MKRALISILIAFLVILAYYTVALIAGPITGGPPMMMPPSLYTPISLPSRLYRAIAPDSIQTATMSSPGLEPLMFFVGNVLLMSIIVFVVISLFSKRRD